jgi:TonB-dependent SusC/RagA subfamily outer membrane receptor
MKRNTLMLIFFYWLIFNSCKVSYPTYSGDEVKGNTKTQAVSDIETPFNTLSILDYLRRVPGIQISGHENNPEITVRNATSVGHDEKGPLGETGPLFVIDDTPVGNNYATVASMIDVNDIKSVTVLKDVASTSEYGMLGANGVIVIHTKKTTDTK